MLVPQYEDDRGVRDNKDSLGTVLYTEESGRGIEGQSTGRAIKEKVRNRNGRGIIQQNKKQIWGDSRRREKSQAAVNNRTREEDM